MRLAKKPNTKDGANFMLLINDSFKNTPKAFIKLLKFFEPQNFCVCPRVGDFVESQSARFFSLLAF
jgi:hypothetical protein